MFLILTNYRDAQASSSAPTDASAVRAVVPKTFVHARAFTGMCDLNPRETLLAATGDTLLFQPFASVGDNMIRLIWV